MGESTWGHRLDHFPAGMVDLNPVIAMDLMMKGVVGTGSVADEIRPTPAQFELKPGDHGMLALTEARINQDCCFVEILDPEKHKGVFPDYADRLMKSYVLASWWSSDDETCPRIGWFHRVRVIPVTEEMFQRGVEYTRDCLVAGVDDEMPPPDWMEDTYREYVEELHAADPTRIAQQVTCPMCGSHVVELHAIRTQRMKARAGIRIVDGKEMYQTISDREAMAETKVHLHCGECFARAVLDEDEVDFDTTA